MCMYDLFNCNQFVCMYVLYKEKHTVINADYSRARAAQLQIKWKTIYRKPYDTLYY